jgi:thiamine pyrophosphokinase
VDAPTSPTVLVVAGGSPVVARVIDDLPHDTTVVAVDAGIDRALALGRRIDVAVGDFDSVSDDGLEAATRQGARIDRHPAAKDAIDLELALDAALELGARRVVVVGASGGREDFQLANALLMASAKYADLDVESRSDDARIHVVRRRLEFDGTPSQLVSLLPVHGPALGVRTEGLVYPLHGEDLPAGTSRGASNQLVGTRGVVTIEEGVLLCVLAG